MRRAWLLLLPVGAAAAAFLLGSPPPRATAEASPPPSPRSAPPPPPANAPPPAPPATEATPTPPAPRGPTAGRSEEDARIVDALSSATSALQAAREELLPLLEAPDDAAAAEAGLRLAEAYEDMAAAIESSEVPSTLHGAQVAPWERVLAEKAQGMRAHARSTLDRAAERAEGLPPEHDVHDAIAALRAALDGEATAP
jgi:hypothetical protein